MHQSKENLLSPYSQPPINTAFPRHQPSCGLGCSRHQMARTPSTLRRRTRPTRRGNPPARATFRKVDPERPAGREQPPKQSPGGRGGERLSRRAPGPGRPGTAWDRVGPPGTCGPHPARASCRRWLRELIGISVLRSQFRRSRQRDRMGIARRSENI